MAVCGKRGRSCGGADLGRTVRAAKETLRAGSASAAAFAGRAGSGYVWPPVRKKRPRSERQEGPTRRGLRLRTPAPRACTTSITRGASADQEIGGNQGRHRRKATKGNSAVVASCGLAISVLVVAVRFFWNGWPLAFKLGRQH